MHASEFDRRTFLAATTTLGLGALTACASEPGVVESSPPRNGDFVAEGWGPVADAFRANFEDGRDLGAACCVYLDGRVVVDLWGGIADSTTNRAWDRDTVVGVASTTKGATAMCAHLLVQRGQLDLDAPVTRYWPEFGAAGKQDMPVRYLLSHQAGLPAIDAHLSFEEICAWTPVIHALEAQRPMWTPGTAHLYHAFTYGFLVGEVVRRVSGKTLGTFFQDEIAVPLRLSAWIGLPQEIEPRLAQVERVPPPQDRPNALVEEFAATMGLDVAVAARLVPIMWGPDSILRRAGSLEGAMTPEAVASRAFRAAEFPAANMIADAASIARMYAATVSDVDGFRLLQPQTVAAATVLQTDRTQMFGVPEDLLPATDNLFDMSLGFWRPSPPVMPLLGPASFGHPGSGGSLGTADPSSRVGFGYVANRSPTVLVDTRAIDLTAAVRRCLG